VLVAAVMFPRFCPGKGRMEHGTNNYQLMLPLQDFN